MAAPGIFPVGNEVIAKLSMETVSNSKNVLMCNIQFNISLTIWGVDKKIISF